MRMVMPAIAHTAIDTSIRRPRGITSMPSDVIGRRRILSANKTSNPACSSPAPERRPSPSPATHPVSDGARQDGNMPAGTTAPHRRRLPRPRAPPTPHRTVHPTPPARHRLLPQAPGGHDPDRPPPPRLRRRRASGRIRRPAGRRSIMRTKGTVMVFPKARATRRGRSVSTRRAVGGISIIAVVVIPSMVRNQTLVAIGPRASDSRRRRSSRQWSLSPIRRKSSLSRPGRPL